MTLAKLTSAARLRRDQRPWMMSGEVGEGVSGSFTVMGVGGV